MVNLGSNTRTNKLKDGSIAAHPMNGVTKGRMTLPNKSSTMKSSAASRTFMEGYDGVKTYLANFTYADLSAIEANKLFGS
ncbi:MAG: hypothetical protein COC24_003150 [Alphaproteobacteria bacterium]|nr:hypothetical protein [Alphaproteobacteria bacterium]